MNSWIQIPYCKELFDVRLMSQDVLNILYLILLKMLMKENGQEDWQHWKHVNSIEDITMIMSQNGYQEQDLHLLLLIIYEWFVILYDSGRDFIFFIFACFCLSFLEFIQTIRECVCQSGQHNSSLTTFGFMFGTWKRFKFFEKWTVKFFEKSFCIITQFMIVLPKVISEITKCIIRI